MDVFIPTRYQMADLIQLKNLIDFRVSLSKVFISSSLLGKDNNII
jgi:hypothetical protein